MMMMMILLSHKDGNRLLPAWTRSRFYRLTCRATPRFANGSTAKPTWRPNCGTHTSSVCMTAARTKVSSILDRDGLRRRHRFPTSARRPLSRRYARRRSRNDHDSGCRRSGLRPPGSATSRCQARQHHARRSRRRRRPRVVLTDFGITRNIDDISGLTTTNMTVGAVARPPPSVR